MCRIKGINTSGVPVGTIQDFGQTSLPSTFLPCDGTTRDINQYLDLYNKITTTYNTGGEPIGHFRLPNATGRTRIRPGMYTDDAGAGPYSVTRTAGQLIGAEKHSLTQAEGPQHLHAMNADGRNVAKRYGSDNIIDGTSISASADDGDWGGSQNTGNSGNNTPHNNMQPTLVVGNVGIAYI